MGVSGSTRSDVWRRSNVNSCIRGVGVCAVAQGRGRRFPTPAPSCGGECRARAGRRSFPDSGCVTRGERRVGVRWASFPDTRASRASDCRERPSPSELAAATARGALIPLGEGQGARVRRSLDPSPSMPPLTSTSADRRRRARPPPSGGRRGLVVATVRSSPRSGGRHGPVVAIVLLIDTRRSDSTQRPRAATPSARSASAG